MGWFRRQDSGSSSEPQVTGADEPVTEVAARPLTEAEQAVVAGALQRAEGLGVDVDDLQSIQQVHDDLLIRGDSPELRADVEAISTAIGEHLVRSGGYRWAMVTDPFGVDIGLESTRGTTTVIPATLVAARWMRHETGWITAVVGHLARVGASR